MSWSAKAAGALLLARLAAPVTTVAQFSGTQFGVAGGGTFPVGDFHSNPIANGYGFRTGWQGMAFVSYRIADTPVGLRLDGSYSVNTSHDLINGRPSDGKVQFLGWDADLTVRLPLPKRVNVYLLGGLGFHKVTLSFDGVVVGATPTNHAENIGGGVTAGALFFEARYVHVDGWGVTFTTWDFVSVTAGLRLLGSSL
jgi:hypothetical protein